MGVLEAVLAEFFVRFALDEDFCWSELRRISFQRYQNGREEERLTASVSMKSPRTWTFPRRMSDDIEVCSDVPFVCEGATGVGVEVGLASDVDSGTSSEVFEIFSPAGST